MTTETRRPFAFYATSWGVRGKKESSQAEAWGMGVSRGKGVPLHAAVGKKMWRKWYDAAKNTSRKKTTGESNQGGGGDL